MKRVFVDFHHSSLLRSLVLLFEKRLGMEVYRPIGMEWFHEGYWAINDQEDTARQFLHRGSQPVDKTPALNEALGYSEDVVMCYDPGMKTLHRACSLDYFKNTQFDYVIATIPAHVPLFKELIAKYQPQAKLIIQMGNNWNLDQYENENILASIAPQIGGYQCNIMFYHQEFDLEVFHDTPVPAARKVYSFLNVIKEYPVAWRDYTELKRLLGRLGWEFKSFGGQCPDGNMTGPEQLASKMREAAFIFHVKPGGDGFGHIIHNAYAVGRPVITRSSHYAGQLAEQLLVPGTFIDLDRYGRAEVKNILTRLMFDPDGLEQMGRRAAQRFDEVVNYEKEAEEVRQWLVGL